MSASEVKLSSLCTELRDIDWRALGIQLGVSRSKIQTILQQNPHNRGQCLMELMYHWTSNGDDVSWAAIAVALKSIFQEPLAKTIIRKYCSSGSRIQTDDGGESKSIEVNKNVHDELMQLNLHYSSTIKNIKRFILERLNRSWRRQKRLEERQDFIVFVATFLGKETHIFTFEEIFDELCKSNDIFKIDIYKLIIRHYFPTSSNLGIEIIQAYECKVQNFLRMTLISQLKDKVIEVIPHSMFNTCDTLSIVLTNDWNNVAWNLLEKLMKKVFGIHDNVLIHPMVTAGCVIVKWWFTLDCKEIMIDLVVRNSDILYNSDVIQLLIGEDIVFSQETYKENLMDEQIKLIETSLDKDHVAITIQPMSVIPDDVNLLQSIINPKDNTLSVNKRLVFERSTSHTTADECCSVNFDYSLESTNPWMIDDKNETCSTTEDKKKTE